MTYRVTILKRLVFHVESRNADEAKALAMMAADGRMPGRTTAATRASAVVLEVEGCEESLTPHACSS